LQNVTIKIKTKIPIPLKKINWNKSKNGYYRIDKFKNSGIKIGGGTTKWNTGPSSKNVLPRNASGFVQMTIGETKQQFMIGLSEN